MGHPREFRAPALAPALALALFGLALGCATNPVTGKKEISFVSESQELAAGKQALAATESEYGYYEDAAWTARVNAIGQKLASVSHRPTLEWEFHVIDDPAVNDKRGGGIMVERRDAQYDLAFRILSILVHDS